MFKHYITATCLWLALSAAAQADVWGYVDETGTAHIATFKLDDRYTLYFRGDETALIPSNPPAPANSPETNKNSPSPTAQTADNTPSNSMVVIGAPRITLSEYDQRILRQPSTSNALRNVQSLPAFRDVGESAGIAGLSRRAAGMAEQLAPMIHAIAAEHNLDPALVKAVISVESGFNPLAISHKGARGLMQVMPTSARPYIAQEHRQNIEQGLLDPLTNLRAGVQILRNLMERYSNNLTLTLAAYNAGEGAVQRYGNQVPPYRETQSYVKLVKAAYALFKGRVVSGVERSFSARTDRTDSPARMVEAPSSPEAAESTSTVTSLISSGASHLRVSRLFASDASRGQSSRLRTRIIIPSGTRIVAE